MSADVTELSKYQLLGLTEDGQSGDLLRGMPERAARIRLQALISEWLRMENLVVLTGSGTSVSSGGKTMANLEKAAFATLKALPDLPEAIRSIIEVREIDTDLIGSAIGFEEWLSFVANAVVVGATSKSPFRSTSWQGGQDPTQAELTWFVEWLRKSLFAECALSLGDAGVGGKGKIAPQLAFLSKLVARDSNLGRTHFFTLNYDTLFEQALELLGIQYFDGFTGRAAARFDPAVYGLDVYYPGEVAEGRVRRFDKFLHLYKLHGSIHWFEDCGEMRSRHPDLKPFESYARLDAAGKAASLGALAAGMPSMGILPTANKFAQTLTMPYAHLFRSFQIRLGAPQTFLLVLGYGFGDDHVSRIIENALMNPSLVLLVVEPNPDSPVVQRIRSYKDLGKRAYILTPTGETFKAAPFALSTFDDFATSVMPDVQWLEDFLRLRKFEKQISISESPKADGD